LQRARIVVLHLSVSFPQFREYSEAVVYRTKQTEVASDLSVWSGHTCTPLTHLEVRLHSQTFEQHENHRGKKTSRKTHSLYRLPLFACGRLPDSDWSPYNAHSSLAFDPMNRSGYVQCWGGIRETNLLQAYFLSLRIRLVSI
jgi:hypothetical protein